MDMSWDEHSQTYIFEPGGDIESIEHQHDDSKLKSGSPIVEAGGVDASMFTSPMVGAADLLKCPTVSVNSDGISEEESKGCAITNGGEFPVPGTADLLNCPTVAVNSDGISEEESKGCVVANGGEFPVSGAADVLKCPTVALNSDGISEEDNKGCVVTDGGEFPVSGTADLLKCPTVAVNSEEESKGCVVANGCEFPASCKSACPLTISETDNSKCGASREVNGSSVENREERSVKDDDGDLTACKLTPLVSVYEADNSKCLGSAEGKVSGVENVCGASDKDAHNPHSRERKKSKYLCYPFVGLGKGSKVLPHLEDSENEEAKSPGNASSLVKCSRKRKEPTKSLTGSVKLETITASSAELLMQLHLVALDHLNPYYNSLFDPTLVLFDSFRISVFRGLSNSEVMGVVDNQNDEAGIEEGDADFHPQAEKKSKTPVRKTRKDKGQPRSHKKPLSDLHDVNVNFNASSESVSLKPQKKRKRKEAITSAPVEPNQTPGVPDGPKDETGKKKKRMRKKVTTPSTPFINGKSAKPISLEVCLQDAGLYTAASSTGLNANVANPLDANGMKPTEFQTPERVKTATGLDTPEKYSAELTLDQMKQSLELMTSMLENSSSTISPETRSKLENEIKNLLKKVNPMVSPSS